MPSTFCSASRNVRPVKVRNTSSRLGRRTSTDVIATPAASSSRSRPGSTLAPSGTRKRAERSSTTSSVAPPEALGDRRDPPGLAGADQHEIAGDPPLQRIGRALGDDAALVDDEDAVAQRIGLVEVVGGEEQRGAVLGVQAADVLPEVGAALRIEPRGRLVEEQQPRHVDEPHRDVEPTPLATGQGADDPALGAREVEPLHQLGGAAAGLGGAGCRRAGPARRAPRRPGSRCPRRRSARRSRSCGGPRRDRWRDRGPRPWRCPPWG